MMTDPPPTFTVRTPALHYRVTRWHREGDTIVVDEADFISFDPMAAGARTTDR